MPDHIQFRRVGDEVTAVYLNGHLARVGDSYLADEWLANHYGVEIIDDTTSACMVDARHALPTLAEVEAVEQQHARLRADETRLRAEAAELLARADSITVALR